MVFSINNGVFSAPIPGQGLTQPVGASPNQHPPQFVHLDDALNFTWNRFHKPKTAVKLLAMLKAGAPVEVLARTIIYQGLLQNKWTPTLALLMLQTVVWQIEAIAKLKKIKVQTFVPDIKHNNDMLNIGNMIDKNQSENNIIDNVQNQDNDVPSTGFKGFF